MGKNTNSFTATGNIGQDLSLKYMPNGEAVLNFSLACANDYKDKQSREWVNQVDWIDCVAFGKTAEFIANKCSKGTMVLINNARYRKRAWTDKSGDKRYTSEFVINEWASIGAVPQDNQGYQQPAQQAPAQQAPDDFDDKIPY